MGLNWVCSKLREWVGTVTGKGDRWGGDSVGRSAPAFLRASTTALPHLPALHGERQADIVGSCCVFAARPANCWLFVLRPVPGGESAGCVRLQWLCSAGCVPACLCHAIPTALLNSLPPFILLCPVHLFCFAPCSVHVRQDRH